MNLAVRDAQRRDSGLRARYIEEKDRAVVASPVGRGRYNEIKGPFLERVKAGLIGVKMRIALLTAILAKLPLAWALRQLLSCSVTKVTYTLFLFSPRFQFRDLAGPRVPFSGPQITLMALRSRKDPLQVREKTRIHRGRDRGFGP